MNDSGSPYGDRYRGARLRGWPRLASEVADVEREVGIPLPVTYKACLLVAGRFPPREWAGSDCTVGYLSGGDGASWFLSSTFCLIKGDQSRSG